MQTEEPNSKDIYLELEGFIKLCNSNHVSISEELLEIYEQHKLLYPKYRLIRPPEYLQAIFEQQYGQNRNNEFIEIPEHHVSLYDFENLEFHKWHHETLTEFTKAFEHGHPLDQAHNKREEFILKPSKDNFRPWSEYLIDLKAEDADKIPIKKTSSVARHFYSPWQIYILNEANEKHTHKINVLKKLKDNETSHISEKPRPLSIIKWESHFISLWQYCFRENLLLGRSLHITGSNILEGNMLKDFHRDSVNLAKRCFSEHQYESWIEFLKTLCGLHFQYEDSERIGLSKCVKGDIRNTIEIIIQGTEKDYRTIIQDVGQYINGSTYFHSLPLERIFPEYETYIKREVKHLVQSGLEHYNKSVPQNLQLDASSVESIIDYAFVSGNETLLVSIIRLNREYFNPSYFGNEALFTYIRSMASAIEVWTKKLSKRGGFNEALNFLTNGDFQSCCNQLAQACSRTNMICASLQDLKQLLASLSSLNLQRNSNPLLWMKFIIKGYLIRNYAAHHTKLEPELFGSTFIEIYNSLTFLVFFAWKTKI